MDTIPMITRLYKISRATGQLLSWSIWQSGVEVFNEWTIPSSDEPQSSSSVHASPEKAAQAMSAAITKKKRYGYVPLDAISTSRPIEAMLANKYNPSSRPSKQFPFFTQPKYDGIRCLYCAKSRKLYSRTTREIVAFPSLLHLLVSHNFPSLDGELYSHALSLEQINSYVSRSVNTIDEPTINYMVYDMPVPDMIQQDRIRTLEEFFNTTEVSTRIQWSEYHVVHTHENVVERHADYVGRGYEGLMLRHPREHYRFGTRSSALLKYKVEQDDYFPIHSIKPDRRGHPIFTLRSPNGLFNAVIEGTDEERKRHLTNAKNLIGRKAHVRFMCLTDLGIPRHARIVTIER